MCDYRRSRERRTTVGGGTGTGQEHSGCSDDPIEFPDRTLVSVEGAVDVDMVRAVMESLR